MPRRPDRPLGADPEELDTFELPETYPSYGFGGELWPPARVDNAVEEYRGRHRREVPKSTRLARLRKAFRRG